MSGKAVLFSYTLENTEGHEYQLRFYADGSTAVNVWTYGQGAEGTDISVKTFVREYGLLTALQIAYTAFCDWKNTSLSSLLEPVAEKPAARASLACRSIPEVQTFDIPSSSSPESFYKVKVWFDAVGELKASCSCEGYKYRHTCRHLVAGLEQFANSGKAA